MKITLEAPQAALSHSEAFLPGARTLCEELGRWFPSLGLSLLVCEMGWEFPPQNRSGSSAAQVGVLTTTVLAHLGPPPCWLTAVLQGP